MASDDPRPRVGERRARKEGVREILDEQREDEEVERVERPAEESRQDGVALIRGIGCAGSIIAAELQDSRKRR